MKTRIILLLAFFSVLAQAQRVPRSVFNASEYDKAKAEALAEGKDLALIVTSLNSTCPHAVSGTESVFKKMKSDYVLVLQDLSKGSETGALSKAIKQKTYKIYNSKGNVDTHRYCPLTEYRGGSEWCMLPTDKCRQQKMDPGFR